MSGIVGSYFNTRGSGIVAKLGTDGQVFTSTGAGLSQGFEAAAGGGKIAQVLTVTQLDDISAAVTSFTDISGMTLAITPSASDSKILWNFNLMTSADQEYAHIQIVYGDASALTTAAIGNADGSRTRTTLAGMFVPSPNLGTHASMQGLDSPNTTSETTYKLQWFAATGTFYLNRRITDTNNATFDRSISTLTLMEVLA